MFIKFTKCSKVGRMNLKFENENEEEFQARF